METIPKVSSLGEIYPEATDQEKRWRKLRETFKEIYGESPKFIARSPGRVNIIGEHIDYSLYDVLPMAVTADLLIAVAHCPSNGSATFKLSNMQAGFPAREFTSSKSLEIDPEAHDWANYFKAGYNGALEMLEGSPANMKMLVDGDVPSGSGLSSSAAFVCASILATLIANGKEKIGKNELVERAIVSERQVGVNSGGMDQSASVLGMKGAALYVSFKPELFSRPVKFPKIDPEIAFVVAQSFVTSNKRVTAPRNYNLRVVECSIAAKILAKRLKLTLPKDQGPLGFSLRGVQDAYFHDQITARDDQKAFSSQLEEMLQIVDSEFKKGGYTKEEVLKELEISDDQFNDEFTAKVTIEAEKFKLWERATHVFSEALRVLQFMAELEAPSENAYIALGELMDKSQDSCRDLYECSCPELDEMCAIARRNGSYGSRLTGAGWGGCCVHLVSAADADRVVDALKKEYYAKHFPDRDLADAIIMSRPGSGACWTS